MRVLPEASVSAISPAFHLKARRVSYLRVSRLGVRLLFAFEPNRGAAPPPSNRGRPSERHRHYQCHRRTISEGSLIVNKVARISRSSALIVGIISLVAIITSGAAIALKALVAPVAVIAPLAIVRSITATPIITTVPVGRIQPGAIVAPVTLLLQSTVPARLVLQPLSVAGIQNVVQSANHVIHALGGTRACTGHRRQQPD